MAIAKHPLLTRNNAIRALVEIFECYFGAEKGSGEMYQEFAEDLHLCEAWDGDMGSSMAPESLPPSMWELLAAAGIHPDHFTEACRINPLIAADLKAMGYGGASDDEHL